MNSADNEKVIAEFVSIAGSDQNTAKSYLRKSNFSLTHALNDYYKDLSLEGQQGKKRSQTGRKTPNQSELTSFFKVYSGEDGSGIGPSGIEKMCSHLDIDPLDILWLIIAHRCECQTMGHFTLDEWKRGMKSLGCASISDLKEAIPSLRDEIRQSPDDFKELYQFSFKYSLDHGVRNLPLETALALWHILLPYCQWELSEKWIEFVESDRVREKGKAITKDVWNLLLGFARDIPTTSSIVRFDRDSGAWPILFDDFYDYLTSP